MEEILFTGARSRGEIPRLATVVLDLIAKTEKYLLISNSRLTYCNKQDNLPLVSYSWFKVSKMQVTEDTIDLLFGNFRVYFESEKTPQIQNILLDILPRILRPTELISFGYFESPEDRPAPTPISAMLRLTERAKLNNSQISKQTFDLISEILTYSIDCVDFSKFDNQREAMQVFFDILPLCPTVTTIQTYNTDNIDVYDLLSTLVCESSFLESIEVEGPITKHYDSFLRHLSRNKDIPLHGLTFSKTSLNETNLRSLAKCMTDKYICSISLKNAISKSIYPCFYNIFLPIVGKQLTVLNLEGMPDMDIDLIVRSLSYIEALSFANCQMDIIEIFKSLSSAKLESLRLLNVSGNKFNYSTQSLPCLPHSVTCLQMQDVKWEDNSMVFLFTSLSSIFSQTIRLDLSRADASQSEFQRLFNAIRPMEIKRLSCLIWDENPVASRFFNFLAKNTQIDYLSLSGCFSESDGDMVKHLEPIILKSTSLKSLVIKGTEYKYMGANICSILRNLQQSKTIEYVDLSDSRCRDRGIIEARGLFTADTPIAFLNIDGAFPRSPKSLFDFCWKAAGNKRSIAVSFPYKDLKHLHSSGLISDSELYRVTSLFKHPQPTLNEEVSPFELPFEIYREENQPLFPRFLKPTQPSPDGMRTVDMANTSEGDATRTELTIEVGDDGIRLVPVESNVQLKKGKKSKSEENLMTLEEPAKDENHPVKKKRKRIMRKKISLPQPPQSDASTDHSQKSGSQKQSGASTGKKRKKNSSTASSNANEKVEKTSDVGTKKKKIRKVRKSTASQETNQWAFPIPNTFDDVFKKIFHDAEKKNQIDDLLDQVHKL